ncbi:MAG: MBL fold metallo-hydrolase [Chloroflexi bacterium]|nr:MAG: MBL fold metallo-hydrolase [Chloroflexota bacterium]
MSARKLIDNVYEIQLEYVRVFVLDGMPPGEVTLVDTGFERTAKKLIAILEDEFGSVNRVILTHKGGDHYGGLTAVMERFHPKLYVPADEIELLEAIDYVPDVTFADGDVLEGGIEVVQVHGHSRATSALYLREKRALISGDVLDGADRRGLPAGYLLPPPEMFNYDHAAAERNLAKLLDYDFDKVFVFHGSHVMEDARIKLDRYLNFKQHYRQSLLSGQE